MKSERAMSETWLAEEIVKVLPEGSWIRVAESDHSALRFVVNAERLKLRSIVLSRASLRRLMDDPARGVKVEYLQKDLLWSAGRRSEFRYPRPLRRVARRRGVRRGLTVAAVLPVF
ncbi:MAG TPA: hypothetical protein VFL80_08105 [Thermoanaerobaculia bacterium]|nr:hypothetical protein [Thermoanaerobaculia bacterium]